MKRTPFKWVAYVQYLDPADAKVSAENPASEVVMKQETQEATAPSEWDARMIIWRKYKIRGITNYAIKRIERMDVL